MLFYFVKLCEYFQMKPKTEKLASFALPEMQLGATQASCCCDQGANVILALVRILAIHIMKPTLRASFSREGNGILRFITGSSKMWSCFGSGWHQSFSVSLSLSVPYSPSLSHAFPLCMTSMHFSEGNLHCRDKVPSICSTAFFLWYKLKV